MAEKALAHHEHLWAPLPIGTTSDVCQVDKASIHFLDVAAGLGYFTQMLSPKLQQSGKPYTISCTDVAQGMLDLAAASTSDPHVRVYRMDGQDMPAIADASIDGINCLFGLMFMTQHEKCEAEMRRVLKPGGKATVATWHTMGLIELADTFGRFLGALSEDDVSLGSKFMQLGKDPKELQGFLNAAGFADVIVSEETIVLTLDNMELAYRTFVDNHILRPSVTSQREGAIEPSWELFQEFMEGSPLAEPYRRSDGQPGCVIKLVANMAVATA